jgi:conjugative relaxase-like TrwC/TraI family protein
VLTVAKVTQAAAAGYADYLEGKAQAAELGDYYLKDGERVEAPGRWVAGAAAIGCNPKAVVADGQLRALLAVRRPDNGGELRRAGGSGTAVAALDATFSAPKSVSAAWAIADRGLRDGIERAHEDAIDQALEYSVRHVAMIRERIDPGTVIHSKPKDLIATSWRHTTARSVDGRAPDPQLHSHVLLHAAVRRDGRIVAIDSRSWLVHQREVGAAYRTELAQGLHKLGFEIQRGTGRGGRYFEIAGIPQELIDQWSSRHHQVQTAIRARFTEQQAALEATVADGGPDARRARQQLSVLRRYGQLAPAEERFMSATTRAARTRRATRELDDHWRKAAARHRLDRAAFGRLRAARPQLQPATRRELLDALTEFDATFHAREARAVALERSAGLPITPALDGLRELRAADEILVLTDGTGTTRQHRNLETTTVALAARLAATAVAALDPVVVTRECERLDRELHDLGGGLSDGQHRAIELGCGTRALVMIEGQAGTGKSTTLIGIARAHQACRRELIVTSTAALAAERLARELSAAGVEAAAYSTVALTSAVANERLSLTPNTTVIHDEAALASTTEQHDILMAVHEAGARLIDVGDPRQNQPVGASCLWHHLETTSQQGGALARLTRNQRALHQADARDQARFRQGQHELALRGYAGRGRIHTATNHEQAENAALTAAHTDRRAGRVTIVIAQTSNQHLDELNARAQALRIQHPELGPDSIASPGRPYRLHPGDQVQVRRTTQHATEGQLRNGTTGMIESVNAAGRVVLLQTQDGHQIALTEEQAARADLRLAYVQHPFPAQGQTTDSTHVIVAEHATREGSYVALTRARDQTHLYARQQDTDTDDQDELAALADHISRTEPDLPSIDTPIRYKNRITARPTQLPDPGQSDDETFSGSITTLTTESQTSQSHDEYPVDLLDCPLASAGTSEPMAAEPELIHNNAEEQPDRGWPRRATSVHTNEPLHHHPNENEATAGALISSSSVLRRWSTTA